MDVLLAITNGSTTDSVSYYTSMTVSDCIAW